MTIPCCRIRWSFKLSIPMGIRSSDAARLSSLLDRLRRRNWGGIGWLAAFRRRLPLDGNAAGRAPTINRSTLLFAFCICRTPTATRISAGVKLKSSMIIANRRGATLRDHSGRRFADAPHAKSDNRYYHANSIHRRLQLLPLRHGLVVLINSTVLFAICSPL